MTLTLQGFVWRGGQSTPRQFSYGQLIAIEKMCTRLLTPSEMLAI